MLNSVVQVTVNTGQSFTLVLHSPWTMFSKRLINHDAESQETPRYHTWTIF